MNGSPSSVAALVGRVLLSQIFLWERVERGSRTVLISDVSDRVGERVAQVTLEGTWVNITATVSAPELLDVAFSVERVIP